MPITYRPLHRVEIAIQHAGGRIERRLMQVLHEAEALGRTLRDLPEGARLSANERRHTAWNRQSGEFEFVCQRCRAASLILERECGGVLQRHAWCCDGEPVGSGWQPAKLRQHILAVHVDAAAATFNGNQELADEAPCAWTPTAFACSCGTGQVEAQLLELGGRWKCRCTSCGASSAQ